MSANYGSIIRADTGQPSSVFVISPMVWCRMKGDMPSARYPNGRKLRRPNNAHLGHCPPTRRPNNRRWKTIIVTVISMTYVQGDVTRATAHLLNGIEINLRCLF